ncbi:MAG: alanyl-tRNA synthetase [Planctomycetota bacterium]|jgi:alanyl-tRNA synthetase
MTSESPETTYTQQAVRQTFIDFFSEREHRVVRSSSVFPEDDPTLLFTNAGMNQFKDVFLGTGTRDYRRAVDSQKCIRVSGKHNDLEEVGRDTYHHTFFEMLGNWSFGNYFKEEAITWAWKLLTEVWGLPKERLWVSVFGGEEGVLPADEEAERLWLEKTDIDPSRVLRFDRRDNFWEMGDTGPCGPCSEIHIDRGPEGCNMMDGADPEIGVNAGNERFIELWNLVFMQFNRLDDGSLKELPACHVDTGMGFERILAVLQGKNSNYDTDLFQPIFRRIEALTGQEYTSADTESDIAFRIIADHVRAFCAAVADGALPSNTGRGYVLRRLVRRAARYGRQALGMEKTFLFEIVPTVADILGDAYPEIRSRIEHLQLLLRKEEESFGRTLGRGLVHFEKLSKGMTSGGTLDGRQVFDLYATYGFPRDLVELMARERELNVDGDGWDAAEDEHRQASKSDGQFKQLVSAEQLEGLSATVSTYHSEGDDRLALESTLALVAERDGVEDGITVVLTSSPFYAEAGGQVGDSGVLEGTDGTWRIEVTETRKMGPVVLHLGQLVGGILPEAGTAVRALVDGDARARTQRNHTATHLLHKALRHVLGDHVQQQGSFVGPDRLRFDFANPRGVTPEELDEAERLVNEQVFGNRAVHTTVEDLEAAKARGVTALFGEKYEDDVRVVDIGGWSTELCGGTHVNAAGDIGPFVIVSEAAIQAGVRRIEAVTGEHAVARMQAQRQILAASARALKVGPEEVPARISALQDQIKQAKKDKQAGMQAVVGQALDRLRSAITESAGIKTCVVDLPDMDQAGLRELGTRARGLLSSDFAAVIFGRQDGRVPFIALADGQAIKAGLKAGDLAKIVSGLLGGGGGGKPENAQGQGLNPGAVEEAITAVKDRFQAI